MHPDQPWVLASLFNGNVHIWNYETQNLVKTFEVTDLPCRIARFVTRKQWVVTGSDDMCIRVYNYNTMEKLKTFEAHMDYIRCIVVHPTQPFILSSSDDMLIKMWDWEKNWTNTQTFEGHSHYVMSLAINPKDTNTFASASLDRTIKVWNIGSPTPNFSLEGHEKGVNYVDYYIGGEKPYLISGADDKLVKIWDYQNKSCVQTLEGHTHNVSVVCFHPQLPIIITGSEDGTVRIWHANTYRLEKTLNYGLERSWCASHLKGTNLLALGYDEGCVVLKLGREEPAISMDLNGKIIWARHNEIRTMNIKTAPKPETDGEALQLTSKELGNCEVFPQTLKHNSNGRFVVVCGDGEYIIYTALAWRNKSFGNALDFVWANDVGDMYAVRESSSKIKIFKNFKEIRSFRPPMSAEAIFGGTLLGVNLRESVCLYDWEECQLIRRIDVVSKAVYWSDNAELMTIACDSSFFILRYNKEAVSEFVSTGQEIPEDGIEEAFEVLHEVSEKVQTAIWVGDCFIYTNSNNRLNYCVGGEVVTVSHLDKEMYLLGYLPQTNRLYLADKSTNIVSYTLHLTIINYQTAVLRGDMETANKILPEIPQDQRNRIAQFLDAQGYKEEALKMSIDPDHKFELAIQLGHLDIAHEFAKEADSEHKWKQLGDLAISSSKLDLAEQCLISADDINGLLLLYTSTGNAKGMEKVAQMALERGMHNIAFISFFLLNKLEECINLLCETGRIPEAAFLARTYLPTKVSDVVALWKEDLKHINERAAESLADPTEYENLFPDIQWARKAEAHFRKKELPAASEYLKLKDDIFRDLIEEIKTLSNDEDIEFEQNDEEIEFEHIEPEETVEEKDAQQQEPKYEEEKNIEVTSPDQLEETVDEQTKTEDFEEQNEEDVGPTFEEEEEEEEDDLAKEIEAELNKDLEQED